MGPGVGHVERAQAFGPLLWVRRGQVPRSTASANARRRSRALKRMDDYVAGIVSVYGRIWAPRVCRAPEGMVSSYNRPGRQTPLVFGDAVRDRRAAQAPGMPGRINAECIICYLYLKRKGMRERRRRKGDLHKSEEVSDGSDELVRRYRSWKGGWGGSNPAPPLLFCSLSGACLREASNPLAAPRAGTSSDFTAWAAGDGI